MTQFDTSLFNQFLSLQTDDPQTKINELLLNHKNFELSVADFSELTEERNKLFQEHHLLDFSWQNTQAIAGFLAKEQIYYKREYLEQLLVCQSIFYYLRAYHSGHITDQEILATIQQRYQKYQGDLELLQGSFEDFPVLEEDE